MFVKPFHMFTEARLNKIFLFGETMQQKQSILYGSGVFFTDIYHFAIVMCKHIYCNNIITVLP